MCLSSIFAQKNNTIQDKDFVQDSLLIALQKKISENEIQRLRDSIKNILLEVEVKNYKSKNGNNTQELIDKFTKLKEEDSIQVALQKAEINTLRSQTTGICIIRKFYS